MSKKNKRKGAAQDRALAQARHEAWLRTQPHYIVAEPPAENKLAPNADAVFLPVKPFPSVDAKYAELAKTDPLPAELVKGHYYRGILEHMPAGTQVYKGENDRPVFISPLQQPGA